MTDEQKAYSDWLWSLDHDDLFEETIRVITLAADEPSKDSEYIWQRRACLMEWRRRDGNDIEFSRALDEATVKMEHGD
jgi:hypothetical protein